MLTAWSCIEAGVAVDMISIVQQMRDQRPVLIQTHVSVVSYYYYYYYYYLQHLFLCLLRLLAITNLVQPFSTSCQWQKYPYCPQSTLLNELYCLFGLVARLDSSVPAGDAPQCAYARHPELRPLSGWRRPPRRPRQTWLHQTGDGSTAKNGTLQSNENISGGRDRCYGLLTSKYSDDDDNDDIKAQDQHWQVCK